MKILNIIVNSLVKIAQATKTIFYISLGFIILFFIFEYIFYSSANILNAECNAPSNENAPQYVILASNFNLKYIKKYSPYMLALNEKREMFLVRNANFKQDMNFLEKMHRYIVSIKYPSDIFKIFTEKIQFFVVLPTEYNNAKKFSNNIMFTNNDLIYSFDLNGDDIANANDYFPVPQLTNYILNDDNTSPDGYYAFHTKFKVITAKRGHHLRHREKRKSYIIKNDSCYYIGSDINFIGWLIPKK